MIFIFFTFVGMINLIYSENVLFLIQLESIHRPGENYLCLCLSLKWILVFKKTNTYTNFCLLRFRNDSVQFMLITFSWSVFGIYYPMLAVTENNGQNEFSKWFVYLLFSLKFSVVLFSNERTTGAYKKSLEINNWHI